MPNQRDADRSRRSADYIRRDDGTWGMGKIVAGFAFLGIMAALIFIFAGERTGDPVTPRSPGATSKPTPSTTQPATAPKQ